MQYTKKVAGKGFECNDGGDRDSAREMSVGRVDVIVCVNRGDVYDDGRHR